MTAPDPRVGEPRNLIAFATECADPNWSLSIPPVAKGVITDLLAELADRDEKLARVEDVLAKKYLLWAAICGNTCSKDILGVDHDAIADEIAAAIRAAVAAANGGGE